MPPPAGSLGKAASARATAPNESAVHAVAEIPSTSPPLAQIPTNSGQEAVMAPRGDVLAAARDTFGDLRGSAHQRCATDAEMGGVEARSVHTPPLPLPGSQRDSTSPRLAPFFVTEAPELEGARGGRSSARGGSSVEGKSDDATTLGSQSTSLQGVRWLGKAFSPEEVNPRDTRAPLREQEAGMGRAEPGESPGGERVGHCEGQNRCGELIDAATERDASVEAQRGPTTALQLSQRDVGEEPPVGMCTARVTETLSGIADDPRQTTTVPEPAPGDAVDGSGSPGYIPDAKRQRISMHVADANLSDCVEGTSPKGSIPDILSLELAKGSGTSSSSTGATICTPHSFPASTAMKTFISEERHAP
ncbi:hypothetical protein CYMTET_29443 [Cymbomonas tetramitiformis]|uniref:Uncharacterized protein n=1 Tax=Cymbomonas tetramitiformis TaxID=36881 RepID=A0AAE0KUX5_9CHLO|nr:hypothetical protein CYMTET_29443 [Cymbomonas tetramitiformis]